MSEEGAVCLQNPETVSFLRAREKSFQPRRGRPDGGRPQCVAARSRAPPSRCLAPAPRLSRWRVARAREESLQLGAVPCVSAAQAHLTARRPHRACMRAFYYNMRRAAALYHIARGIILYRSRQHIISIARELRRTEGAGRPVVPSPRRRLKTFFALRISETVRRIWSRLLCIDPATRGARSVYLPFALATPKKSKSLSPSKTPARRRGHPNREVYLTPGAHQGRGNG